MTASKNIPTSLHGLGYGCAGAWGMPWFSEQKANRLVMHAAELGISHFDTGPSYAKGNAESRLGRIMKSTAASKDWFVSTKTGTRWDSNGVLYNDFSEDSIRTDVENSLRRFGRERLDLLYLHGPSSEDIIQSSETVRALQQEGKVHLAGICGELNAFDFILSDRELQDKTFSVAMGVFNIFKREHRDAFIKAHTEGLKVIAIAPLAQGVYNRNFFWPTSASDLWTIARALIKNRPELNQARSRNSDVLHDTQGWRAAELALSYVLAQPFIDAAIFASTRSEHLDQLVRAAIDEPPANAMARIEALTDQE